MLKALRRSQLLTPITTLSQQSVCALLKIVSRISIQCVLSSNENNLLTQSTKFVFRNEDQFMCISDRHFVDDESADHEHTFALGMQVQLL